MKNKFSKKKLILIQSSKSLRRWRWRGSWSTRSIGIRLIRRSSRQWIKCFSRSKWTLCARTNWSLQTVTFSLVARRVNQLKKISTRVLRPLRTGMRNQYQRIGNLRKQRSGIQVWTTSMVKRRRVWGSGGWMTGWIPSTNGFWGLSSVPWVLQLFFTLNKGWRCGIMRARLLRRSRKREAKFI